MTILTMIKDKAMNRCESTENLAKKGLTPAKRVFERRRVCPFSCGPIQKYLRFNEHLS